jgi:hypothetical protein
MKEMKKIEESNNAIHLRKCIAEVSEGLIILGMIMDTNTLYRKQMIQGIKDLIE